MVYFLFMFTTTFARTSITAIAPATSNTTKITIIITTTTITIAVTKRQLGSLFLLVTIDNYLN